MLWFYIRRKNVKMCMQIDALKIMKIFVKSQTTVTHLYFPQFFFRLKVLLNDFFAIFCKQIFEVSLKVCVFFSAIICAGDPWHFGADPDLRICTPG